jgi:ubiquinone/menaquinone biosynthesis C-methylase UbiE
MIESSNMDDQTVRGFGEEWSAFDQSDLTGAEFAKLFNGYFGIFPFDDLPVQAEGFDLGCGSGRWAAQVVDRVGLLHCIDPSEQALAVARRRLSGNPNVRFHLAPADAIPLADGSQDFGYSLGVLHHIPDTAKALRDATRKLKPGAPFLLYLYYAFDQRPAWFRTLWQGSDLLRRGIARLPFGARRRVTDVLAAIVYLPLARTAKLAEAAGADVAHLPLSAYRYRSFYSMRTDALDRFGTRLEQRFTRPEIEHMMRDAQLTDISFSEEEPFWVALGFKA